MRCLRCRPPSCRRDHHREQSLDEEVVLRVHAVALRRIAEAFEQPRQRRRCVFPSVRFDDGLHERDSLHTVGVLLGIVEAEARSPVVEDQNEVAESKGFDERVEVLSVIEEPAVEIRLPRKAHTDQVDGNGPPVG